MANVYLSVIMDKEGSEARVVPFDSMDECVMHNARVALKLAKEAHDADANEDDEELIDELQLHYDNKDMDSFGTTVEGSFLDDRFSFEATGPEVNGSHLSVPEDQLPSW